MVRLNINFAGAVLLSAALTIAARPTQAQSTTPGPAVSPATSGEPMHWRLDPKNGLQPAAPSGQPVAPSTGTQPVAPDVRTTPSPQATPAAQNAPPPMRTPPNATPQLTPTARTAGQPPQQTPSAARRRAKKTAVAEPPAPPPPPPTPEQLPPTPPQVRFQNGELTIDAQNSTLSQVLRAVQSQTGASVDIPASAGSERVVAQIGPGPACDVLKTLLNGSRFDYVILGVAGNPGAVQKVLLTPRQSGAAAGAAVAQISPTPQQQESEQDEGIVAEGEPEYQNPQPPVPPPGGFRRPILPVQPPDQQQQQQQSFTPDQQNGGKTPEQLMQELQQIQQQQQQYQEQLNPANRQPQQ